MCHRVHLSCGLSASCDCITFQYLFSITCPSHMVTHTPSPHKPHPTLMLFPSHEKISAGPPVSHDTPDSQRSRLSRACSRCSASCVTSSETFMPRLSETYCRPGLAYRRSSESPVQQEDPLVRVIIWRAHICFPSSETFGPRLNRPAIVCHT